MKAREFTRRGTAGKVGIVAISLAMLGYIGVTVPLVATEVYDYYTADECKADLTEAIDTGIQENSAIGQSISDVQTVAARYAESAHRFAAAVAAPRCPLSIAGPQAELAQAIEDYAEVQEAQAATGNVNPSIRASATENVVKALRKVYPLIGMEEPG